LSFRSEQKGDSARLEDRSTSGTCYDDNPIIGRLPNHLKQFVVDQQYDSYTPIDHAVWRYVMRQNYNFLKDKAHPAYVEGLEQTGIGIEMIPSVEGMNDILGKIGWAAVPVDGFIPPAAFMEFQAHRVLVIAADIRRINHIEYTPAPDIIHEAAGHAPIIANAEYAEYLRRIGAVGARAMSSRRDYELYQAIRHLSILKEQPDADPGEVEQAEADVEHKQKNLGEPSEMALLSRMHWWTVEYGLIGSLENPQIYGAGLLSSIGESSSCLTDKVKKLPYNLDTANYAFDITTQQPHLFVTPGISHLIEVLDEFAESMAYRTGGQSGLDKAIECRNTCTYVYSSGLQVSGIVSESLTDDKNQPILVRTSGPTMLSIDGKALDFHTKDRYPDGFVSPVGSFRRFTKPLEDLTDIELGEAGISLSEDCNLTLSNGISISGKLYRITRHGDKLILLTFYWASICRGDVLLYDSGGKTFHLTVGDRIVSVFGGAADKDAYDQVSLVPRERTVRSDISQSEQELRKLYREVRHCRETGKSNGTLPRVWRKLQSEHTYDWLLAMEIVEILHGNNSNLELMTGIIGFLKQRASDEPELSVLIQRGLALIS
jgi:phenylalanine-4-hydroxylase